VERCSKLWTWKIWPRHADRRQKRYKLATVVDLLLTALGGDGGRGKCGQSRRQSSSVDHARRPALCSTMVDLAWGTVTRVHQRQHDTCMLAYHWTTSMTLSFVFWLVLAFESAFRHCITKVNNVWYRDLAWREFESSRIVLHYLQVYESVSQEVARLIVWREAAKMTNTSTVDNLATDYRTTAADCMIDPSIMNV